MSSSISSSRLASRGRRAILHPAIFARTAMVCLATARWWDRSYPIERLEHTEYQAGVPDLSEGTILGERGAPLQYNAFTYDWDHADAIPVQRRRQPEPARRCHACRASAAAADRGSSPMPRGWTSHPRMSQLRANLQAIPIVVRAVPKLHLRILLEERGGRWFMETRVEQAIDSGFLLLATLSFHGECDEFICFRFQG